MTEVYADKPMIASYTLKGHRAAVLCLDHNSSVAEHTISRGCLLSGSEDRTARLWDLRDTLRAWLCIKTPGEVLSVAFCHTTTSTRGEPSSIVSTEHMVYLSVEKSVLGYDVRKATFPIIKEPSVIVDLRSEDEVNQIGILPARNGFTPQLAACDDAGCVRVTDCFLPESTAKRRRILSHSTSGGMVTTTVFRPHSKTPQLASGGTDCVLKLWDVTKPRKELDTVLFDPLDDGMCNPPMVHQLAWSPSGRILAAALGDGSVGIAAVHDRSLSISARLVDSHTGSVACVLFPEWTPSSNRHMAVHDRLFCTAGNDATIVLWDLGAELCGPGSVDPSSFLPDISRGVEELCADMDELKVQGSIEKPRTLFAWQHSAKPNWMVSSRGRDPIFPSTLFISDTTSEISAYSVRL